MTVSKITNAPTQKELIDKTNEIIDNLGGGGGSSTDVQINGTSITSQGVANILTNSAYDASSNKIATMGDLPSTSGFEVTSNKVTSISSSSTDTQYPSAKCVYDEIQTVKRNIGEIVTSTIPLTDAGLHLLDGSLLQYGSYQAFIDYIADLYDSRDYTTLFDTEANWQTAVTTYGVCGKFVYDSTNNTVRLPKITGIIEGTTDATALGDLVEAGLPNITGGIETVRDGISYSGTSTGYGALFNASTASNVGGGTTGLGAQVTGIRIDASRSSSIYGNSSTVQPQTIKVLYYIVIANSTKTAIQVDIDEIATDLNGEADVDLSNITSIAPILRMLQTTDSTKVGYIYYVDAASANVYAPNGGKWLVLRNEQVNYTNTVKYGFNSGTLDKNVGTIVDGGTQVAAYSSQVSGTSCQIYVTLLKIA